MRAAMLIDGRGGLRRRRVSLRPWVRVHAEDALGKGLRVECLRCRADLELERLDQALAEEALGGFNARHDECK